MNETEKTLVTDNIRLVHYIIRNDLNIKISQNHRNYADIESAGLMGLCKAARKFDSSKSIEFATFASKCIKNEIFMWFRKTTKTLSLEFSLYCGDETFSLENLLADPYSLNFEERIHDLMILIKTLSYILNILPKQESVALLFTISGLSQKEIGNWLNCSQSYASRLLKKARLQLKDYHLADYPDIYSEFAFKVELTSSNQLRISYHGKTILDSTIDDEYSFRTLAQFVLMNE